MEFHFIALHDPNGYQQELAKEKVKIKLTISLAILTILVIQYILLRMLNFIITDAKKTSHGITLEMHDHPKGNYKDNVHVFVSTIYLFCTV